MSNDSTAPIATQIASDIYADLDDRIHRTRLDIAALRHPKAPSDRFAKARAELGAVAEATEAASNLIFGHVERVEEIAGDLLRSTQDDGVRAQLQEIVNTITQVYEVLGFQDLTGQRMNKVRQTLDYVEHRISSLTTTWGQSEIEALPLPEEQAEDDEARLLNGPRSDGEAGVDQADIDAMFD